MAIIRKKIWPGWFELVDLGKKNYDLRLNDFEVEEGDTIIFEEWNPETKKYTGRKTEKKVKYVGKFKIDNLFSIDKKDIEEKGLQIMSLE